MNPEITPPQTSCEPFEIAISAMVDGELSPSEKTALGEHLLNCKSCRQVVREFESVNRTVLASSLPPGVATAPTKPRSLSTARSGRRSIVRYVLGVAAAVAAASVLLVVFWPPAAAETEQLTAEQIIQPMEDLHLISLEQERDQAIQLKALEFELRYLKLELAVLEATEDRFDFATKVDKMMNRVNEKQIAQLSTQ
ncbi:MAG: zf-HC2 domain-containing protein [Planctomycetota bacterium]